MTSRWRGKVMGKQSLCSAGTGGWVRWRSSTQQRTETFSVLARAANFPLPALPLHWRPIRRSGTVADVEDEAGTAVADAGRIARLRAPPRRLWSVGAVVLTDSRPLMTTSHHKRLCSIARAPSPQSQQLKPTEQTETLLCVTHQHWLSHRGHWRHVPHNSLLSYSK